MMLFTPHTRATRVGLSIAPLFLLSLSAWAETQTLDETVIRSTRISSSKTNTLRNIHVISPENMAVQHESIADTLNEAGILALSSGNSGQVYRFFSRGAPGRHQQFTLDGFRIGSVNVGGATLNAFSPYAIQRIEVLKGESSALNGSGAMGSAIALYSKTAKLSGAPVKPDLDVSYEPRYGKRDVHAGLSVHSDALPIGMRLDIDHSKSSGYSITTPNHSYTAFLPLDPDKDGYEKTGLSALFTLQPNSNHKIDITLHDHTINADIDFGKSSELRQELYGITGEHHLNASRTLVWKTGISIDTSNTLTDFGLSSYTNHINQTSAQLNQKFSIGEGFVGAEYIRESLDSNNSNYTQLTRTTQAFTAGYHLDPRPVGGELNVRYEHINGELNKNINKASFSGRIATKIQENALIGIGGGNSFHAPSFALLYDPYSGNPELQPETVKNIETFLRYNSKNLYLQGTLFRSLYRNLIVSSAPTYIPENIRDARIQGIELESRYTNRLWKLTFNHTIQQTRDNSTNQSVLYIPKHFGSTSLEYKGLPFIVGSEVQWVGKRQESPAKSDVAAGYVVVNAKVEYPFQGSGKGWSAYVQANNLLNADYESIRGYATPKASLMVGMRYRPSEH